MTDPTTWDAGDHDRWERPANPPCPDCLCCSSVLCKTAIEKDSACHFEGTSADYDLSNCPCWRQENARRLQEDHGETMGAGYVDPEGLART